MTPWTKPLVLVAITGLLSFGWVASSADDAVAASCTSGLTSPTGYADGSGTQGDPWQISNQAQLVLLSETDADHASYFEQTADITLDLSGCDWIPIGGLDYLGNTGGNEFKGEYDGGNHVITGFNTTNLSLFNDIEGESADPAVVKNLSIENVSASSFNGRGILALTIFDATVQNVHISGTLSVAGNSTAGFAKESEKSLIESSTVDLTISSTSAMQYVGGFFGLLEGSAQLVSSSSSGAINLPGNFVGGLVGELDDNGVIRNSSSSMDITSSLERDAIGGLVGELDNAEIRGSFATGDIVGAHDVGGLVGLLDQTDSKIYDSFARGSVSATRTGGGDSAGGGLAGRLELFDRTVARTYSTGSVTLAFDGTEADLGAWAGQRSAQAADLDTYANLSANFFDTSSEVPSLGVARSTNVTAAGALGKVTGLPTSDMTSYSTYRGAGWAIVDGWAEFSGPDSGDPDPDTHNVWGICSGVNDGYPFLLWQYDSNPCPATAAESSGRSMDERVDDAGIHLDVQGVVAEQVAGSPVVIGGQGLAADSAYTLVLRSTPQVIESGVANAAGNFSKEVVMPAGITPGAHSVTLTAIGADGSTLSLVTSFVVSPSGVFSSVSPNVMTATAGLAATGPADELRLWGSGFMALLLAGVALTIARARIRTAESL